MESAISKTGRYMFAVPFVLFGLFHFMMGADMAGMVPIPGGLFWVYLTGAALVAAGVSMIIQKHTWLACVLLGVMLLIFVVAIHLPGAIDGSQASTTNALKDITMAGAAFYMAGHHSKPGSVGEES